MLKTVMVFSIPPPRAVYWEVGKWPRSDALPRLYVDQVTTRIKSIYISFVKAVVTHFRDVR